MSADPYMERVQRRVLDLAAEVSWRDARLAEVEAAGISDEALNRALTFWLPLAFQSAAAGEPCAFVLRFDGANWNSTLAKLDSDLGACVNCGASVVEDYRSDGAA